MRISKIHVKSFRSILDEEIPCDSLTALVGKNGSGKSTFLAALEYFYDPTRKPTEDDFYNRETSNPIEIKVTFSGLSAETAQTLGDYVKDGTLEVTKVLPLGATGTYHGVRLQCPGFQGVRQAGGKAQRIAEYRKLREQADWEHLPKAQSADAVENALSAWEAEHPDQCSPSPDSGDFFNFAGSAKGSLAPYTSFLRIPAVRDAAADALEGRGSSITQLMDLVVRHELDSREDVANFRRRTQAEYEKRLYPTVMPELKGLQSTLSDTLSDFAPDSALVLHWSDPATIDIPLPQAEVRLAEDGYQAAIQGTGHGLQRAFIFTMLQHLAAREGNSGTGGGGDSPSPTLVLAIDEPELYQHPSRQRHLAGILRKLATGVAQGVAASTQVLYTTHSPLFLGLDWFDQIRVLRKVSASAPGPKVTDARATNMEAYAREIGEAVGKEEGEFTGDTLRPRLASIMTPWMNEGFFADVVVLVEGEADRAAILWSARAAGLDFDRMGIAVIPCSGKTNIDRPLVIFRQLAIPVYVVWDGDMGNDNPHSEANKRLCHLVGREEEEWPAFLEERATCFEVDLENTLEVEIGEQFRSYRQDAQAQLGLDRSRRKNPKLVERILDSAAADGNSSSSLETIVNKVVALQRGAAAT